MVFTINATKRVLKGEKARADGQLPAVVYGVGKETLDLSLNNSEFLKLNKEASESSLIDLTIDGKEAGKILLQEVQYDPISDRPVHVDLRRIDMNKPIEATIELHFIGEAPAVKAFGGTLVHNVEEIEVKCLPKDLMSYLEVSLATLNTFEDSILVKDLVIPSGVTVLSPPADNIVAKVTPAMTEDEIKALEDASKTADLSKIEVAGKKKDEEEEAGEGKEKEAGAEKKPAEKDKK